MELDRLKSVIEAILFTADHPVPLLRITETVAEGSTPEEITQALSDLKTKYADSSFGFELREAQGGYHFCTKVENADWVRKFLQSKPFRLGKSTLETLSIIAYRQPITRAEIDKVRGIDSSHLMRTLVERGLVKMAGKAEVPGRPVQYATTEKFLEVVGLKSLNDLPPLSELEQLKGTVDDPADDLEQNLDKFVEGNISSEEPEGEYREGLEKIDEMLSSAMAADQDVYESQTHAEVARENRAAVEGFLASFKPHRRTIQFEDVAAPALQPEGEGEPQVIGNTDGTIGNA